MHWASQDFLLAWDSSWKPITCTVSSTWNPSHIVATWSSGFCIAQSKIFQLTSTDDLQIHELIEARTFTNMYCLYWWFKVFFAFFMRFNADIVFKRDLLVAFQRCTLKIHVKHSHMNYNELYVYIYIWFIIYIYIYIVHTWLHAFPNSRNLCGALQTRKVRFGALEEEQLLRQSETKIWGTLLGDPLWDATMSCLLHVSNAKMYGVIFFRDFPYNTVEGH